MSKKKKNRISGPLLDRAKRIGMSPEQIATYTDEKALMAACNRIKPQATTYAPVVKKPAPAPKKAEQFMDTFDSVISLARSHHTSRVNYDEMQINSYMVRKRINPKQVETILISRDMKPDKRNELVTRVHIKYVK
jgi:hypothetical protein